MERRYEDEYGEPYRKAQARVRAAVGKPIASLFELPKSAGAKICSEVLFIERCLALLRPGGKLGIVLPEGFLNNPSHAYVREFCEDRAFVKAVISLPQETFVASGASVKASIVFLEKFTEEERREYECLKHKAAETARTHFSSIIQAEKDKLEGDIRRAETRGDRIRAAELRKQLGRRLKELDEEERARSRAELKLAFSYPVFMYDAEHVGITATGEPDANELLPTGPLPGGVTKSALEHYREFVRDPDTILQGRR